MSSSLDDARRRLRIVLCNTTHPGNIGAAARAMKTMGLGQGMDAGRNAGGLTLVAPRRFPSAEATARAAGADDILANAKVCATLDAAIAGCVLVAATTARARHIQWPAKPADEAAAILLARAQAGQPVAILFGPEHSGLSNADLDRCNFIISIPANPDFSSLNIAAAVQIICYELHRRLLDEAGDGQQAAPPLVTAAQMGRFYQRLEHTLILLDYLDADNPGRLMRRLRRLFGRNPLDEDEYNILMGVLAAVPNKMNKPG